MKEDFISEITIDELGRLHVTPSLNTFPYMYREAMEVTWDSNRRSLRSPTPKQWSYWQWFNHILAAAKERGTTLLVSDNTIWTNVDQNIKDEMIRVGS